MKVIWEDAAPVKLCMMDGTKQAKVCMFCRTHLRQIIRGVSKSWATQSACNWESVELSGIVPTLGFRDMENTVHPKERLHKKAPWR